MSILRAGIFTFVLSVVAAVPCASLGASFDLRGFIKDFFIVQDPPAVSVEDGTTPFDGDVSTPTTVANNVRVRLDASARLSGRFEADVAYNLIPRVQNDAAASYNELVYRSGLSVYRIDDLRPSLAPREPGADDDLLLLQNLDRLLVTIHAPAFDVYVGRQAIAWGSSKAVSPTDILAPFLFTEIDTEDRIGVDAVRVRAPTGALGELDFGYAAGKDARWKQSAAFLRGKGYLYDTDVSLLAILFRENALLGIDATRAVGGAGVWCEAAVAGPAEEGSILFEQGTYTRVTVGADYSLHNATYLFLEYHYNGAGTGETSDYSYEATTPAYTDGAVYLLGRHYLIPGFSYPASLILTVGGSLLANLDDGSLLAAPTAEYNVMENVYLAAGAFVGFGKQPRLSSTTATPVTTSGLFAGEPPLDFASEFGAYPDLYFVSARYYF
jgi:hypothetical protein